jgi:hypothetical protein
VFDGGETELQLPDREIAGGGGANGERGRRKKKEERGGRKGLADHYASKGTSLGGALL